ncbi:Hypothetical predicted protein, partial [Pelobates cultripes]
DMVRFCILTRIFAFQGIWPSRYSPEVTYRDLTQRHCPSIISYQMHVGNCSPFPLSKRTDSSWYRYHGCLIRTMME